MALRVPFLRAWWIQRKAAEWHSELLDGAMPERRAKFEAWLAADPEHAREYRILDAYSELSSELPRRVRQVRREVFLRPAYAFALVIVVLVGGTLLITNRESGTAYAAVTNRGPAIRGVRLSDGSTVLLDIDTSLSVAFKAKSREVEVQSGRARFTVAPDPKRPFIVTFDAIRVTSRGGEFDVDVRGNADSVAAARGIVFVGTSDDQAGGATDVSAGKAVRVDHTKVTPISVAHDERLWPAGRLWFDQTPLSAIVAMANRLGGPPIHVADGEIGAMKVTCMLDLRDTQALAQKLAATFDLRAEETPNGILLTR